MCSCPLLALRLESRVQVQVTARFLDGRMRPTNIGHDKVHTNDACELGYTK
jgi:hypothetical protein